MRKSFRKIAAGLAASALAFTLAVTMVPNAASAAVSKAGEEAGKAEFDPAGTYHAYFGMQQTTTWIFRDPWYSEELGKEGAFEGDASFDKILTSLNVDSPVPIEGATVTDAEITGNGTYTVGVEGLNGALTAEPDAVLAMIYVDTDVPTSASDTFQISDVKLALDDKTVTLPEEIFFNDEEQDSTGLIRFDPVNTYQKDKGTYANCPSIVTPTNSIKITFTVSGMTNDNPDAVEATPTPAAEETNTSDDSSDSESSSISPAVVAGIVVVVVVIAGVVVVMRKKK